MDKRILLKERLTAAYDITNPCHLCPRKCFAKRFSGEKGFCKAENTLKVAAALVHSGEEPPISGKNGSGTVFFSHCHLKCIYCQNYEISLHGFGKEISVNKLAGIFISFQEEKQCHNVNIVSGTHYLPYIMEAFLLAFNKGFSLPIVWNSSGYESLETLALLDGIVDIYLTDAKYGDTGIAWKLSSARNYPQINKLALQEMYRQVGSLQLDKNGIAICGLIVRHLVLPNNLANSRKVLRMIEEMTDGNASVSLMGQYFPTKLVEKLSILDRNLNEEEWFVALHWLDIFGIKNGWIQKPLGKERDDYIPIFNEKWSFPFSKDGEYEYV